MEHYDMAQFKADCLLQLLMHECPVMTRRLDLGVKEKQVLELFCAPKWLAVSVNRRFRLWLELQQ